MQNRSPITSCLYFTSNKNIDSKDSDDYFFLYSTSSTSYDILTSQNSDLGIEFAFFSKIFNAALIGTIRVFGGLH